MAKRVGGGLLPESALAPLIVVLIAAIGASAVVAAGLGSVDLPPQTVIDILRTKLTGAPTEVPPYLQQIFWELRLPRILLAALVGAGLSLAGVAIQGLVRNPIADPYVLGVSSGASIGAAFVLLFGGPLWLGNGAVTIAAFLTALGSMLLVYGLAQRNGTLEPLRLVLTGVVLSYVFSGVTSFLVFQGDPRAAQSVMFWLLGSFGRARWSSLLIPAVVVAFSSVILMIRGRQLDAMLTGDESATTLGVPVRRLRLELFLLTAALTAVMVAVSGAVAFVGLVIPHVTRLLIGSLHRRVYPVACLLGAAFMVLVDVAARSLAAPQEIPLGILTSVIGGPVFVLLMRHQLRGIS
ncbi:FecCD family ABC transporter permease [Gephyromycinifex aptenodytis]|uniref:FecCD family ABC transporter permease n=1 Tax=Gephyromycinifex aptenodytis TaxID=2716227 RepID=UPI001445C938|nr:iron ABC transporter permease [Gephyromycinifex aptenodytis]